jgi:hypothetical protein
MSTRMLHLEGMHNVRDLGGLPIAEGAFPTGVVVRGETVVHLSTDGARHLVEHGVGHVLDLRDPDEARVDGHGHLAPLYDARALTHDLVPLAGGHVANDPIGRTLDAESIAERYVAYLRNGGAALTAALARFAWRDSALYVHCAVGKDRTGVVCALLLDLAGADADTIIDDYLLTADAVRPVLLRLGGRPAYAHLQQPDWAAQQPSPDAMRILLTRLEARGGASSWLLDQGMDPETLDLLVARLRGVPARARIAG